MNNFGTQKIETKRLILRRVKLSDAEDMFQSWGSDKEVTRYLTWNAYDNIESVKNFIAFCLDQYENCENIYRWVIEFKDNKKIIGMIDVVQTLLKIKTAQIGYVLSRKYWNNGIMTEALTAVIKYLFDKAQYNRVEAVCHIDNIASGKVMLKSGMRFEGIRRHGEVDNKGNFCDVASYAILKSDCNN